MKRISMINIHSEERSLEGFMKDLEESMTEIRGISRPITKNRFPYMMVF